MLDCFATTGEADYHLPVLCRDLEAYNAFLETFLFGLSGGPEGPDKLGPAHRQAPDRPSDLTAKYGPGRCGALTETSNAYSNAQVVV